MKKILASLLVLVVVVLTGCGSKAVSGEKAAGLFADRLIYQKESKEFTEAFRDGDIVGEQLDESSKNFQDNFAEGLSATGADVTEEEANKLTKELLNQVKKKTSYKVAKVEESKTNAKVTYYVTGLDLVSAMQGMTMSLVQEALANPEITTDDEKTMAATLKILHDQIEKIKIKNEPVEMELLLKKADGKWYVSSTEQEAVSNLFMAFISGTKDTESMDNELAEALSKVEQEIIDSLSEQPAVE